jgi:DNA repair protein RadC
MRDISRNRDNSEGSCVETTDQRPIYQHKTMKETPADDRPREKLRLRGPAALTDAELIAIILGTGVRGENVLLVAQRLLRDYGGLKGLASADLATLERAHGLGPAKATMLVATMTLATRIKALRPEDRPQIQGPEDVYGLLGSEMAALDHEQLRVVLLDTKNRVLRIALVYQGSVNSAHVRVAEVFKDAVRQNAPGIVVVHNHPSGDPTPSAADVALTTEVHRAGKLLGIDVVDHLIVGQGHYRSLRRLGLGFLPTT